MPLTTRSRARRHMSRGYPHHLSSLRAAAAAEEEEEEVVVVAVVVVVERSGHTCAAHDVLKEHSVASLGEVMEEEEEEEEDS